MRNDDVSPNNAPAVQHAMVLAAGIGSRLSPLTKERPKPLVEVLGHPLVHYALAYMKRAGASEVVLNTHHLHPMLQEALGERHRGMRLRYSHEPTLLGTGGGLKQMQRELAPGGLRGTTLAINADALIDLNVGALLRAHQSHAPLATMVLKAAPDAAQYGLIGTDATGRVRTFAGRVEYDGPLADERMYCGVHAFEPPLLDPLPEEGESCVNLVAYPTHLRAGAVVRAFGESGYFCDVGTPERLLSANLALLGGKEVLRHLDVFAGLLPQKLDDSPGPHALDTLCWSAPSAQVHPRATLHAPVLISADAEIAEGATVGPYAVIGEGCVVGENARVERAVLQSGAHVAAGDVVQDAILGTTCKIHVAPSVAQDVIAAPSRE